MSLHLIRKLLVGVNDAIVVPNAGHPACSRRKGYFGGFVSALFAEEDICFTFLRTQNAADGEDFGVVSMYLHSTSVYDIHHKRVVKKEGAEAPPIYAYIIRIDLYSAACASSLMIASFTLSETSAYSANSRVWMARPWVMERSEVEYL